MIKIMPMGEVPHRLLSDLVPELRSVYGALIDDISVSIGSKSELPQEAFVPEREQYRSDIIIDLMERQMAEHARILVITDVDIFFPTLNFVLGQAQLSGTFCIVSIRRLDPSYYRIPPNYELLLERTVKESVHELGHTLGLSHCPNPLCVMSFSNSILGVDRKSKNLCERCEKRFLRI